MIFIAYPGLEEGSPTLLENSAPNCALEAITRSHPNPS
jgi:hypothetical protein